MIKPRRAVSTGPRGSSSRQLFTTKTLEILQDLGFIYHIDDLSRDEPSITPVRGKPFAVVPYTFRNNDIVRYSGSTAMTGAAYLQELKDELDVLYAEGVHRRRSMSISAHARLIGVGEEPGSARGGVQCEIAEQHRGHRQQVSLEAELIPQPHDRIDGSAVDLIMLKVVEPLSERLSDPHSTHQPAGSTLINSYRRA